MFSGSRSKHKYKGHGSYGVVVSPALPNAGVEFPNQVTKVFFNKTFKNKAISNSELMSSLTGNTSYEAHNYVSKYTLNNLYSASEGFVADLLRIKGFYNTNNLYMVRLPDWGIDIHEVKKKSNYDQIRQIPLAIIFQQLVKLFTQIRSLGARRYVHGDIRPANVMIHPRTGSMKLIDFDFLSSYDDFFLKEKLLGFYTNPPELLLLHYRRRNPLPPIFDRSIPPKTIVGGLDYDVVTNYVERTYNDGAKGVDKHTLEHNLYVSLIDNVTFLRANIERDRTTVETLTPAFIDLVFPYYDNYGLANTVLVFLRWVYGTDDIESESYIDYLRGRITKHGVPYTDDELTAARNALRHLKALMEQVGAFRMADRPEPHDVAGLVNEIVSAFEFATLLEQNGGGERAAARRRQHTRRRHRKLRHVK